MISSIFPEEPLTDGLKGSSPIISASSIVPPADPVDIEQYATLLPHGERIVFAVPGESEGMNAARRLFFGTNPVDGEEISSIEKYKISKEYPQECKRVWAEWKTLNIRPVPPVPQSYLDSIAGRIGIMASRTGDFIIRNDKKITKVTLAIGAALAVGSLVLFFSRGQNVGGSFSILREFLQKVGASWLFT